MLRKAVLVTLSVFLSACQSVPEQKTSSLTQMSDPAQLLGEWQLQLGADWPLKQFPSMNLSADGRVSGFAGCNRFMGRYVFSEGQLQLSGIATTRKLCAPAIMAQERILLSQLEQPLSVQRTDATLVLTSPENTALRFSLQ